MQHPYSAVARTRAFVPPNNTEYAEPKIARWLGSRTAVEARFAKEVGSIIPDNYLDRFEAWLNRWSFAGPFRYTHVIMCNATVYEEDSVFELKSVFTRPCAERCGFLQLLILQVLRYCHYHGYDLYIEFPSRDTVAALRRYLPDSVVYDKVMHTGDILRVDIEHWRIIGLLEKASKALASRVLFLGNNNNADDDLAPPPPIRCRRETFPSAHALNFGPAP